MKSVRHCGSVYSQMP